MRSVEDILLEQHQQRMSALVPSTLAGERGTTQLPERTRAEIRRLAAAGMRQRAIAAQVGVSVSSVSLLVRKR